MCAWERMESAVPLDEQHDGLSDEHAGLLIEAARLYYEEDRTQAEIAQALHMSRSTVSRLLRDARKHGIVEITVNYRWARNLRLERELKEQHALDDVKVLQNPGFSADHTQEGMGRLAGMYLESVVRNDMILGVSYGRSIESTIRNMNPKTRVAMTVVQIIGALGSKNPLIEGADLTRGLAQKYGADYRYLYAPLMVESADARGVILQEPLVQDALALGQQADVVLIGIGTPASSSFEHIWSGYMSRHDLAKMRSAGAVGHMCAEFFDENGDILDVPFNQRTISIGLSTLRNVPKVVAVAGGIEKSGAILGALRGGYVDVLITEENAARQVVDAGP